MLLLSEIRKYCGRVGYNGVTFIESFVNTGQLIWKLKIGDIDTRAFIHRDASQLEDRRCDKVPPGQCYRTPHGTVKKLIWSNGGMVVNRVRPDESQKKPVFVPLRNLHEVILD
jgi:hypothetical protein